MSIESKLSKWANSKKGKERISAVLDEYVKNGTANTAAGDAVISKERAEEAAEKFISVIHQTALSYDLPESVMEHISSMDYGSMIRTSTGGEIPIFFGGDLHRDSLQNDLGYNGIDNIVALFNNGYHASNYVYGWWGNNLHDVRIRSRKELSPMQFVQQAVSDFNGNYGADYNATAVASSEYEK